MISNEDGAELTRLWKELEIARQNTMALIPTPPPAHEYDQIHLSQLLAAEEVEADLIRRIKKLQGA